MIKRATLRLLLFGVPFTVGYLVSRPATPTKVGPAFVICAYPDGQMRITPTAKACAAGSSVLVPARQDVPEAPSIDDGTERSIKLPF